MVEIGAGSKVESGMEVRNADSGMGIVDSRMGIADSGIGITDSGMEIADSGMEIAENAKSRPVIIWDLSAPENTVNTPFQVQVPRVGYNGTQKHHTLDDRQA